MRLKVVTYVVMKSMNCTLVNGVKKCSVQVAKQSTTSFLKSIITAVKSAQNQ